MDGELISRCRNPKPILNHGETLFDRVVAGGTVSPAVRWSNESIPCSEMAKPWPIQGHGGDMIGRNYLKCLADAGPCNVGEEISGCMQRNQTP